MKEKVAVLMLLPQCNMTCNYCVIENNFSSFTDIEAQNLLLQLKDQNYTNVILGGGEPTLWRGNVFQLAKFAKSLGFFVQIGTNGINLPKNYEKNHDIDRWIIPLDSNRPEIHNKLRHYKNQHFHIIEDVLKKLSTQNKSVYISTVLTQINKNHLVEMVTYLNQYNEFSSNLKSWNLYRLLPFGRGGFKHFDNLKLPIEEFDQFVQTIKNSVRNFKVTIRRNMYDSSNVDFFTFHNGKVLKLEKRPLNHETTQKI